MLRMAVKNTNALHLVIAINPMVDIYLIDLIKRFSPEPFEIIEFYPRRIISSYSGPHIRRYIHSHRYEYFRDLKKCIADINIITESYETVHFYFAHVYNAVTNHFFFSGLEKYKFHLIPDGIANYYRVTTQRFFTRMLLKKILSFLNGIKYTLYSGHLTGIETHKFESVIALEEKGLISSGSPVEKLQLSWQKREKNTIDRQLLILGQYYENFRQYRTTYAAIFDYTQEHYSGTHRFFFKPHPNEKVKPEFLDLLKRYDIKKVVADRPVEFYARDYDIIVSEASSALSNIRIIYGDEILCIGIIRMPAPVFWNRYHRKRKTEIRDHLAAMGVRIVEL
jgi:hypothetical protein